MIHCAEFYWTWIDATLTNNTTDVTLTNNTTDVTLTNNTTDVTLTHNTTDVTQTNNTTDVTLINNTHINEKLKHNTEPELLITHNTYVDVSQK